MEKFIGLNDKRLNEMSAKIESLQNTIKQKDMKIKNLEEENLHLRWVALNELKKAKLKQKIAKKEAKHE